MVRDQATAELAQLTEMTEPLLRQKLREPTSPEMRRRLELLLARAETTALSESQMRTLRAFEVLELIGTAEVRPLLERIRAKRRRYEWARKRGRAWNGCGSLRYGPMEFITDRRKKSMSARQPAVSWASGSAASARFRLRHDRRPLTSRRSPFLYPRHL